MALEKLTRFLDENDVGYELLAHTQTFTAQETAAAAHVPGDELAKSVMVKVDGDMKMVVLPASYSVSLDRLKETTGAGTVELADEDDFSGLFPGCETGAMPPFGNLWDMDVIVDRHLAEDEEIAFDAGSHTELVRMPYSDFERLVQPQIADVAVRGGR